MPSPVHPYSDYGVALRTLRSARSWLGLMLVVCVLAQFLGFALMWWTPQPYEGMKAQWRVNPGSIASRLEEVRGWLTSSQPASAPSGLPQEVFFPTSDEGRRLNVRDQWAATYAITVPVTQLASLMAVSSQVIIVFVTLLLVLVAQAPGVAQITRSLIWSVLLLFMFMPWQYLATHFPIPGVIYSYAELLERIGRHVVGEKVYPIEGWIIYARFMVWPLVGMLVLLITSERYRAGVMIAIGHPLQSMLQPRGTQAPALAGHPRSMPMGAGKLVK